MMEMKNLKILLLVAACLLPLAASLNMRNANSQTLKDLTNGNNIVAHEIYNILKDSNPGNIVFSPFSIRAILGMLHIGAKGSTKHEIENYMRFSQSGEDLYEAFSSLFSGLKGNRDANVTVEIANKIYTHKGMTLQENFQELQKLYFKSTSVGLDFDQSARAANEINSWVARKTRNEIQNLINPESLNNRTKLVLVNALNFRGLWDNQFFPKATQKKLFYQDERRAVEVDMMQTEHFFRAGQVQSLDAKAIILPYELSRRQHKDESFQMIILVPNQRSGLKDVENKLKGVSITDIINSIPNQPKNVLLNLPKFNIESKLDLIKSMQKLGMRLIFDEENADFSGISTLGRNELHVSQFIQKARINTHESGTEASAATFAAVFTPLSIGPPVEEEFTVDRPFLGYIYDSLTNTVLFMFRVKDL